MGNTDLAALDDLKREKRHLDIVWAVEYGLLKGAEDIMGVLDGFSVKYSGTDVLITLRASFEGKRMVGFVGGADLSGALIKAARELPQNKVKWRKSKF